MSGRSIRNKIRTMSSYAACWRNGGIAFHGRLEFDPYGLWLSGGDRGHELRVEVPTTKSSAPSVPAIGSALAQQSG